MAYSFYPGKPSFLAQKYLREYIPRTTLQPGERYALRRTMEAKVTIHNLTRFVHKKVNFFFFCRSPDTEKYTKNYDVPAKKLNTNVSVRPKENLPLPAGSEIPRLGTPLIVAQEINGATLITPAMLGFLGLPLLC